MRFSSAGEDEARFALALPYLREETEIETCI